MYTEPVHPSENFESAISKLDRFILKRRFISYPLIRYFTLISPLWHSLIWIKFENFVFPSKHFYRVVQNGPAFCWSTVPTKAIFWNMISFQSGQHWQHRRAAVQGHPGVRLPKNSRESSHPEEHHPDFRQGWRESPVKSGALHHSVIWRMLPIRWPHPQPLPGTNTIKLFLP